MKVINGGEDNDEDDREDIPLQTDAFLSVS